MNNVTVLGIDTSKASFSLYGVDSQNNKVLSKTLTREKFVPFMANFTKTRVVIEACGGSHYWGQTLRALGHDVKLIAPQKVKPFVQGNKNDGRDARGIVAASLSPEMTFVPIKDRAQQDLQTLQTIRDAKIAAQTAMANQMRSILAEYGIILKKGINHVRAFVPAYLQDPKCVLSDMLKNALTDSHAELLKVTESIERTDKQLEVIAKSNELCQRLMGIDGVGVITATAILGSVPDFSDFKNGRQFAAWLGLTPGHRQTGGKEKAAVMLGITKCGNARLRTLLVQGGMAVARTVSRMVDVPPAPLVDVPSKSRDENGKPNNKGDLPCRKRKKPEGQASVNGQSRRDWLRNIVETRGIQKAAVAFANKNARTIYALWKTGEKYNPAAAIKRP